MTSVLNIKKQWKPFRYQSGGQRRNTLKALNELLHGLGGGDAQLLWHYIGMCCGGGWFALLDLLFSQTVPMVKLR